MFCRDSSQEGLDVVGMSQWSAQNADPPVLLWALQIPSTPSPLGLKLVRSSPEDRKQGAGPHLSLPHIDADAGMPIQLLSQNAVHETDPIRSGDNVNIVQENEEPLSGEQSCPDRLQSCMLATRGA